MTEAGPPGADELRELAADFAQKLTRRVSAIIDTDVRFVAHASHRGSKFRVIVGGPSGSMAVIPLKVAEKECMELRVQYNCCFDHSNEFLTVEDSFFRLFDLRTRERVPLFRVEYDRNPTRQIPASHFHVHAHRDDFTHLLILAPEPGTRPFVRKAKEKVPRIAEYHFPTGGHRFRPCLEDVLENLVREFGVKHAGDQWMEAIREGREEWRRTQVMTVVRDRPADAAKALRDLGYTVQAPPEGDPERSITDRFTAY
ncbi:hypothetical protein K3N28_05120 [Glycomyces sp. TRM65418]|uniref:hypothetical protein n=1 Tax=Glycomyces sp. TRM65418 TaxID=2867006 RepID=UPI001CE51D6C|nr:hypothetical protein [Glycomyces sp. TRM65418]MCC3762449.1 hypothetical protein [Glycomyces sp. TRM65418]QZD56493.1 hypothetical protein K3N28_05080 [Glycomyces sp. TRM65418]